MISIVEMEGKKIILEKDEDEEDKVSVCVWSRFCSSCKAGTM